MGTNPLLYSKAWNEAGMSTGWSLCEVLRKLARLRSSGGRQRPSRANSVPRGLFAVEKWRGYRPGARLRQRQLSVGFQQRRCRRWSQRSGPLAGDNTPSAGQSQRLDRGRAVPRQRRRVQLYRCSFAKVEWQQTNIVHQSEWGRYRNCRRCLGAFRCLNSGKSTHWTASSIRHVYR